MKTYIKPTTWSGKTAARTLVIGIEIETHFKANLKEIREAAQILHNFLLWN